MASKQFDNKKLWKYAGALVLIIIALKFLNPPQCPDHYTQEQVDASNCIVGANIGLGLILIFIGPVLIVILGLLALAAYRQIKKSTNASQKK